MENMYVDIAADYNDNDIVLQWLSDRLRIHYGNNKLEPDSLHMVLRELSKTDLISDVETMESFFDCYCSENTVTELTTFLTFLSQNDLGKVYINNITNPLQKSEDRKFSGKQLELEALLIEEMSEKVWIDPNVRKPAVLFLFKLQADVHWSFSSIKKIVIYFQSLPPQKIELCSQHITEVFSVIYSYSLVETTVDEQGRSILKILSEESPENWQFHINKLALNTYYKEKVSEYSEEEFCQQLINMNPSRPFVAEVIPSIRETLKGINDFLKAGVPNVSGPIERWGEAEVRDWTERARALASKEEFQTEMIAVLCQATKIHKGFYPRTSQLVSLLILLSAKTSGRVAKIGTGEGKSIVVAIMAAMRALQGRFVDVVTSSPVLAERDAEEYKGLFNLVAVSAGHCIKAKDEEFKGCYAHDVIYADSSTLEGDVLRHEFSKLGTRGNRKFHTVIVDEVDCMLLDQGGHSTRLVGHMPSMEYLEPVLALVWTYTNQVSSRVVVIEGDSFLLEDESKRSVTSLVESLFVNLPGDVRNNYKLQTVECLSMALNIFAETAKKAEMVSKDFRGAIGEVLESNHDLAAATSFSTLSEDQQTETIDNFINSRWNMEDQRNVLFVAEKMLQAHILVFAETGPVEKFHGKNTFHSENVFNRNIMFWYFDEKFLLLSPLSKHEEEIKEIVINKVQSHLDLTNSEFTSSEEVKIKIPSHLKEWCGFKLNKWVDSAMTAKFALVQDKDYVVKVNEEERKILTPIDYENTGVVQDSTVWSDGVHQFLQFKHRISVLPENLPNNFLSNMSFFKKYGSQLYGLTGTLGSDPERALVSEIYAVDTVDVPTFTPRQCLALRDVLAPNHDDWLFQVSSGVTAEVRKGRAVLVICKTIREVYKVRDGIREFVATNKVPLSDLKIYVRSDQGGEQATAIGQELKPGEVVLATNLAGRGADLKLSREVIRNGGLHVCVTFLPQNVRVEEQALGRASRQGQPGTSQLVINAETEATWLDLEEASVQAIKVRRDEDEKKRILKILESTVPQLSTDQAIFDGYCRVRELEDDRTLLSAMDERFAIHLDQLKLRNLSNEEALRESEDFYLRLMSDRASDAQVLNAAYDVQLGNQRMTQRDYAGAIGHYDRAIEKDPDFSHNALYYKAYCLIEQLGDDYKERATSALSQAAVQIEYQTNVQVAEYSVIEGTRVVKSVETEFGRQTVEKITQLQAQAKSIEESLEQIRKNSAVQAELRSVEDYLRDQDMPELPDSQMSLAQASGMCGFLIVTKRPPPWWAVLTVILLGVCQAVVGTVMAMIPCWSAGIYGLGLVVEGISDIVSGVKAAITGEFINLKNFYFVKGISLALSAVVPGAGVVARCAAKFAATAARKKVVVTVFDWAITQGIAKISATAQGKSIKALLGRVTAIKTTGFFWMKAGLSRDEGRSATLFDHVDVLLKARQQASWKLVTLKLCSLGQKLGITRIESKGVADVTKEEVSKQITNTVILGTKLFMSKLAKGGFTELAGWTTDKLIIENIHGAIRGLIEDKVKETIRKELKDGVVGKKIERILINTDYRRDRLNEIASLEFEEERYVLAKFVKKVASMVLSAKQEMKKMPHELQTLTGFAKLFSRQTIFPEFIVEVKSYLGKCFKKVERTLDEIIDKNQIPYSRTEASILLQLSIDRVKYHLEELRTTTVSEKISDMFTQEFLKPAQSLAIDNLTSNMFKLEEFKKRDDRSYKKVIKKREDEKNQSKTAMSKSLGLSPREMADFSQQTGRSIEFYILDDDTESDLKYVSSFGQSPRNRKQSPIRVVARAVPTWEAGGIDLVVKDKKGKVAVVPLPKSQQRTAVKSSLESVMRFTMDSEDYWENAEDLSELLTVEMPLRRIKL